ncbi:hypothetical protein SUDANB6_01671 [Streptomyces sp. enrichment culture]|uniref:DUF6924 domain-containing protein n=1 Tax=Streptomyces sp. enrichment culture TaxID=1795815 RepID=UPI003F56485B
MPPPAPKDPTSTVLRTGFSDDAARVSVRAAIDAADGYPHATYVGDPRFTGVSSQALIDEEAATEEDDEPTHVFLADATTMTGPSSSLPAVGLHDEPGRTFRVSARWDPEISADPSIASMDFAGFAGAADGSGTFRGWDDG